jgi:hypothetical protein
MDYSATLLDVFGPPALTSLLYIVFGVLGVVVKPKRGLKGCQSRFTLPMIRVMMAAVLILGVLAIGNLALGLVRGPQQQIGMVHTTLDERCGRGVRCYAIQLADGPPIQVPREVYAAISREECYAVQYYVLNVPLQPFSQMARSITTVPDQRCAG